MANTKISALAAVTSPSLTDEFAVNQGGVSKKATLSQIRSTGRYVVKDYGALGDGTTSDTTALQAAIDAAAAAGGGTVFIPVGIYPCDGLVIKAKVRLLGDGVGTVLKKNANTSGTYIISSAGTLGTAVNLNANAVEGAGTVTAATNPAGLAAGDYVLIRTATYEYGTTGRNEELNRILSVSGAGPFTFTLANALIGTYNTANTAEIIKLTPGAGMSIESLKFFNPIGNAGGLVHFDYAYDARVEDCYFEGANELASVYLTNSAHVSVRNCDIRDGQQLTGNNGYGIVIGESSHHTIFTGNYTENIRENVFTDGSKLGFWIGNVMRDSYDDAINTHGNGSHRILIANNIVSGTSASGGIGVGQDTCNAADTDIQIIGNYVENTWQEGIWVASNTAGKVMSRVLIANNFVRNWYRQNGTATGGIAIRGGGASLVTKVDIRSNVLAGHPTLDQGACIYAYACDDVEILGNTCRDNGNGYGIEVIGPTTRVRVVNNVISGVSSNNIYTVATNTSCSVRGNRADDATFVRAAGELWEQNDFGTVWGDHVPRTFSLAADHAISSTTATEVTGLGPITLEPGTYVFQMFLLAQSATTTVGLSLGINFTGTAAVRAMNMRYSGTGGAAANGTAATAQAAAGQIMEGQPSIVFSTSAPNMTFSGGVAVAATTFLIVIEGVLVVTVLGDLELWHGSETATSTTIKAGSSAIVTRVA